MPAADKRRARAAALLADLLREQGLRVAPGTQSFSLDVDGIRFTVDVRGDLLLEVGELADLRRQLAAAVEKDPWRFGAGKCRQAITKRGGFGSSYGSRCSRRAVVAIALTDVLSKGGGPVQFVFKCAQHADDPGAKKVPCSEETLKGFAKVWDSFLAARAAEKRTAADALRAAGKCGAEDCCGDLCALPAGHDPKVSHKGWAA